MTIYHFIGIKGTGMSALAHILHDEGETVQGSDVEKTFFTDQALLEKGIKILPFAKDNIQPGLTIIQGNAFGDDHEEVERAKALGLTIYKYHEFLGMWLNQYTSIAVTGAHGKTSTTGLLSHVLKNIEPISYLIGDGTGVGHADSRYFAFEACEYRRHFLSYEPDYAIMTNIDFDHPDYFSSIDDVFSAFQSMAEQVKKGIIACGDDEYLHKIQAKVPVVYYGFNEDNDFQAKDMRETKTGTTFDVYVRHDFYDTFTIPLFGKHNVLNALAVIALCHYEGFESDEMKHLETYGGVKRRFSEKRVGNQVLIDDYAHHPKEIEATLDSIRRKYPNKKVTAVFQPHTYSRTKMFLQAFADSLMLADHVYLTDIFGSARELVGKLSIENLGELIDDCHYVTLDNIATLTDDQSDVIVFMGAGDIQSFQTAYEKYLNN